MHRLELRAFGFVEVLPRCFFLLSEHMLVVQCVYIASGKLLVHLFGGVMGRRLVPYFDGGAYIGHMCFKIFPICPAAPFMALKWTLSLAP